MCQVLKAVRVVGLGLTGLLGGAGAQGTTTNTPTPAAPTKSTPVAANTARTASSVAVEISGTVKGQIVACPKALKVSAAAVCLYVQNTPSSLRPLVRGKLGARALGDWKTSGQASSLLVSDTPNGPLGAFVLLAPLTANESLVVVDAVQAPAASAAPRPATPAGVVKGQPYVLGRDLIGVVNVTSLGGGKFRLNSGGSLPLTVTVGQKSAQLGSGTVELPLAPASDGQNLIFPLAGLRSLGCTFTPAGTNMTVACGSASVGLRPIVF
ncbi:MULTISPECIES: hypothetical protein [Deinococcus]|uniref:Secreted protein n=1 Tax=Deinococcus geothermalis (strain DSM 11300 / CIP 105573 / AG-3a) TaxID=319795 RepID=Q1IZN7_DEIGD|nr:MULTISPECIES: hypothetical protein [Deinococcus]ABF45297.1 hypothetical protein Dgeo_0997 [Deinococcus geothermalis DSM 11300]MBI0444580.1 hypothetical protein [Deinococcus sp. DB0503]